MTAKDENDTRESEDRTDTAPEAEKPEVIDVAEPAPKKAKAGGSKDRNQRVREQARRKLEDGSKPSEANAVKAGQGLDAGEMFDDALARGFSSFLKWLKTNRRGIEIGIAVALLSGIGYATWDWYAQRRTGLASAALHQGVHAEHGVVQAQDTEDSAGRDEDEARFDTRVKFPNYAARQEAALGNYRAASAQYGSLGAGMLARLGEAGILLEKRDFDGALTVANAVLGSELAKADVDVRMAAKEIVGMALEGKGDIDGASKAFGEMAASDTSAYRDLGEYHGARMTFAKGNKAEAKAQLEKLRDRLTGPTTTEPIVASEYLKKQIEAFLRIIDPSSASAKPSGPGGQLTMEQLKRLQEEIGRLGSGANPMMPQPGGPVPRLPAPATSGGH